jgi:uridylate kinase
MKKIPKSKKVSKTAKKITGGVQRANDRSFVISLGGSLIFDKSTGQFNLDFIKEWKNLIEDYLEQGYRFVLVMGGGKTARFYQEAGRHFAYTDEQLDYLGIQATRINALFLNFLFADKPEVFEDPRKIKAWGKNNLFVCGGWKPGFSTDYVSTLIAKQLGCVNLINLSDTDYIYDSDPRNNPKAKKFENLTWEEYFKIFHGDDAWQPGRHLPFDPIASKLAAKSEMVLYYLNGKNMKTIRQFLGFEKFIGTIIN